ncbi:hypothetical protein ACFVHW_19660 [Streptomyces sp. NPDC127110]|uniref:hypothetical protein n=1 Tax=Streptomyces sp. NPDC127110 TaxID=3345362 RepID=UPI0036288C77
MRRSVLFVHGTGVREVSYARSFDEVRAGLDGIRPGIEVRGCFWGREQGAAMTLGGGSVPGYRETGGGSRDEDAEVGLWGILYDDPWYELRLLGLQHAPAPGLGRGLTPAEQFLDEVAEYRPSPALTGDFDARGLAEDFAKALRTAARAVEVRDAAATAEADGYEHRAAYARAVIGLTLGLARDRGVEVSGNVRDALLASLGSELATEGRSLKGKALKAALAGAGRVARTRRGSWGDGLLPMAGDILRYQARGQGVRDQIKRTIENTPGDAVTVIAHSLGGVACVDLLVRERLERVDQLITVGSQAPYLYEIGALVSLEHPEPLPAGFPAKWLNIYDDRDWLSYPAAEVFPGRVQDQRVDNRQPWLVAHTTYWSNPQVWKAVGTWLG